MKKLSKILLRISAFYYLIISISLLLSTIFSLLADRRYIFAIFDLLGFSNISLSLIKPICFVMLLCLSILFFVITSRIFKAARDKSHLLSNIFVGFFFLFLSVIGHVFLKDRIFIISYIFNISLIIGAMLGLRQKSKEYYDESLEDNEKSDENKEDEPITLEDVKEKNEDEKKDKNEDRISLKDLRDKEDDEKIGNVDEKSKE